MAGFDRNIVAQVQQSTDIVDVISEHLSLDKKGREYVGICPFHQDHRPSMYVNPTKQIFKCFACGAGGDAFKFIQLRENLSFPAAVERLAGRAGIKLPEWSPSRRRSGNMGPDAHEDYDGEVADIDPTRLSRINDWVVKYLKWNLNDEQVGASARKYVDSRQISGESVKTWGIGFAPEGWDGLLKAAGKAKIAEHELLAGGFVVARDSGGVYDKFRNRLMFPIADVGGRIVGFGGRTLGDDPAKYMNSPATVLFDKSNCLYGLEAARREIVSSGTAVVVEGYTDVIMAHQFGCCNAVATLGTSFTAGHARCLRRYGKQIVLVFDSDIAGVEAANRALEVCLGERIDMKLGFLPQGQDPCDFLLGSGADAFREVVANAVDVMEFKWQRLVDGFQDSGNLTDRRGLIEEYLRTVARAMQSGRFDPISDGLIGQKLSRITGLSEGETRDYLARVAGRMERNSSFAVKNQQVVSVDFGQGLHAMAKRDVLEVLLNEPGLFGEVAGRIGPDAFGGGVLREIAESVFRLCAGDGSPAVGEILAGVESVEAGSAVVELAEEGEKKGNYRQRLCDALDVIDGCRAAANREQLKSGDLTDENTEALRKIGEMISRTGGDNKRNAGMRNF